MDLLSKLQYASALSPPNVNCVRFFKWGSASVFAGTWAQENWEIVNVVRARMSFFTSGVIYGKNRLESVLSNRRLPFSKIRMDFLFQQFPSKFWIAFFTLVVVKIYKFHFVNESIRFDEIDTFRHHCVLV